MGSQCRHLAGQRSSKGHDLRRRAFCRQSDRRKRCNPRPRLRTWGLWKISLDRAPRAKPNASAQRKEEQRRRGKRRTVEDGPVCCEKAVPEPLSVVTSLEAILIHDDAMYIVASKKCDLFSPVAVENAKKGQSDRLGLGVVAGEFAEVENSRVGVLHADAPALHGGQPVEKSVILALVGSL